MNCLERLSTYRLLDREVLSADPHLQQILARGYDDTERPRCLCVPAGVPMCIVKDGAYYLRRMPDSGHLHHPSCAHYEPLLSFSGRNYLQGDALVETTTGVIEVRSDFVLDRYDFRSARCGVSREAHSLATGKKRLTLHGLLHLLWDRAQFNRWSPNMQGKRSWAVIRRFITQAAEQIELKGLRLSQRLFVPEPFQSEQAAQIRRRREQVFAAMLPGDEPDRHRLLLVIGEVKALQPITTGYRLMLKHAPDCSFLLNQALAARIVRQFSAAFQARDTLAGTRLITAFTLAMRSLDDYQVDTMTLAAVTENWIPFDNAYQKRLADDLTANARHFIKALDYDAPDSIAIPDFLLLDAGDQPTCLHIQLAAASKTHRRAQDDLIQKTGPAAWVWPTQTTWAIPSLPPQVRRRSSSNERGRDEATATG